MLSKFPNQGAMDVEPTRLKLFASQSFFSNTAENEFDHRIHLPPSGARRTLENRG